MISPISSLPLSLYIIKCYADTVIIGHNGKVIMVCNKKTQWDTKFSPSHLPVSWLSDYLKFLSE